MIVEKEELEAMKKALETQTIADDAQRDLGKNALDLIIFLFNGSVASFASLGRTPLGN